MSTFRKSGSRFWQFEFRIRGYKFSGSTKCTDERAADDVEAARRREALELVERFERERREPMTLAAACARWFDEHGRHLAANDKEGLTRICAYLGGAIALHAISDDDVAELVRRRRQDVLRDSTDAQGKPIFRTVTPATVNRTLDLLRRVLRRARDNWSVAIIREPIWKHHRLKEHKRQVRELLPSEESVLDTVDSFDFAELRRFAIITGLRRRSALITWPQVDFELAQIRVVTKGGVPRILPMTREIYEMLWRRRGDHPIAVFTFVAQRTWKKHPKNGEARIRGQRYPITYHGFGTQRRAWKKAGVDVRIHDLRHTTGMRTLRKTGNLRVVQKLLGHTDISITSKFYTDATIEDLRAAMDAASAPAAPPAEAPRQIEKKGET